MSVQYIMTGQMTGQGYRDYGTIPEKPDQGQEGQAPDNEQFNTRMRKIIDMR